ncbi:hypothetical protein [Pseudobacteriovorax antillogorgiicola]|uniref:Lipoprotein n=1 Tax=Pseudobacteriovorax antillogorgiicola TaxID=1513793 RepID=A0A1Y6B8F3_9BACT|nr:hypothetical protein [Pseudobacteriovorax antillogorgiicola]TCS58490.1 hypothetical protein EDD56_1023 [Pseudobacteriovorax antillogorgiicola]SME98298.1 hypothetical protein SAMN06296036_102440 [Pseudobacteriovorax antillogorgiicola]
MLKSTLVFTSLILTACSSDNASSNSDSSDFSLISESVSYREYLRATRPWYVHEVKMCIASSDAIEIDSLETLYLSTVSLDGSARGNLYLLESDHYEILSSEKGAFCLNREVSIDNSEWFSTPSEFRLEAKIRNVTTGEEFLIEGTKVFNKEDLKN